MNGSREDCQRRWDRFQREPRFSALDPKLMLWTLAVIADSGRAIYETMVRRLSEAEREALWQDYIRFGELFGMPRAAAPATYHEFRAWWEGRLASSDLQATRMP